MAVWLRLWLFTVFWGISAYPFTWDQPRYKHFYSLSIIKWLESKQQTMAVWLRLWLFTVFWGISAYPFTWDQPRYKHFYSLSIILLSGWNQSNKSWLFGYACGCLLYFGGYQVILSHEINLDTSISILCQVVGIKATNHGCLVMLVVVYLTTYNYFWRSWFSCIGIC